LDDETVRNLKAFLEEATMVKENCICSEVIC